jgi:hypothetical protein
MLVQQHRLLTISADRPLLHLAVCCCVALQTPLGDAQHPHQQDARTRQHGIPAAGHQDRDLDSKASEGLQEGAANMDGTGTEGFDGGAFVVQFAQGPAELLSSFLLTPFLFLQLMTCALTTCWLCSCCPAAQVSFVKALGLQWL